MVERVTAAAERWSLPSVDGPIIGVRRDTEAAAREAAATRQAEQARGYEAGVAAGRATLQAQIDGLTAQAKRLDAMFGYLAAPLQELEAQVEQQLVMLALAIGKQLARRELRTDPGQIVAIIREAVGRLPAAARDVRVHVHPEDAAVVRERLATPSQERAWTLLEDPTLTRGGCHVRTDTSQIDARLESRVNAIAGSLFGEERAAERAPAGAGQDTGAPGTDT